MGSKKSKPTRPSKTTNLPKQTGLTTVSPSKTTPRPLELSKPQPYQVQTQSYKQTIPIQQAPLPPPQTPRPLIDPRNDINQNSPLLGAMLTNSTATTTQPPQYNDFQKQNYAPNLPPSSMSPPPPPPPSVPPTPPPSSVKQVYVPPHLVEPEVYNTNKDLRFETNYQPFKPPLPFDMDPYYKQGVLPNDDYFRRAENFSTVCHKYRLNMITLE